MSAVPVARDTTVAEDRRGDTLATRPAMSIDRPALVALDEPAALDAALVGAKAANLARLAALGLPVIDGIVVTTAGVEQASRTAGATAALSDWWAARAGSDDCAFVVRSSSTIEDASASSMAGRFTSVLDVRGWEALCAAVDRVLASSRAVGTPAPMAVLVQRQLSVSTGGVLFGADPVRGRMDRLVVEWVDDRPDVLVSGRALASHVELTPRGRAIRRSARQPAASGAATGRLSRTVRRRLADVARTTATAFGVPQDIEWAIDAGGTFWVLQSRPITALHRAPDVRHPIRLGTGPVAETFPQRLTALEIDLWVPPLREGITRALRATGAVGDHALRRSPVVTTVHGWVAIDLDLITGTDEQRTWRRLVSPRSIVRRLRTAWRVGRLRVALPTLAAMVVQSVDEHLAAVGRVGAMSEDELLAVLDRSRAELSTVHSYEVLCGMLLATDESIPMPMVALRALHDGRQLGLDDGELVATRPEVLSLAPPSVVSPAPLPPPDAALRALAPEGATVDDVSFRDALRLRARWLHELQCRVARELGHRAAMRGTLRSPSDLAWLTLDEVRVLRDHGTTPPDLAVRVDAPAAPSPPAEFVIATDGSVLPTAALGTAGHRRRRAPRFGEGIAAGGGRVEGVVIDVPLALRRAEHADASAAVDHAVLVTEHLDPRLAAVLPVLAGLVSETGSALSHLAILAREAGVPTVVAVADARQRFPVGSIVVVDGTAGTVTTSTRPPTTDDAAGVDLGGRPRSTG